MLGALVNSVFLLALCLSIFIEAIERFIQVETIREVNLLLYTACTGLAINTIGLFIFGHGHSHGESAHKTPADLIEVSINDSNESSPITRSLASTNNYNSEQYIGINNSSDRINQSASDDDNNKKCFKLCSKFNIDLSKPFLAFNFIFSQPLKFKY